MKQMGFEREAEVFQALGHPVRLRLLGFLAEGPRCTCEIEPAFDIDQSTISRHLITLKRAGILSSYKEGVKVMYRVQDKRVLGLLRTVSALIKDTMRQELERLEAYTASTLSKEEIHFKERNVED